MSKETVNCLQFYNHSYESILHSSSGQYFTDLDKCKLKYDFLKLEKLSIWVKIIYESIFVHLLCVLVGISAQHCMFFFSLNYE